jgi:hypothetical protein
VDRFLALIAGSSRRRRVLDQSFQDSEKTENVGVIIKGSHWPFAMLDLIRDANQFLISTI